MEQRDMDSDFFEALRRLIIRMIMNHDGWYKNFATLLAAYDSGDWHKAEDELKLYNLRKFNELTFAYHRETGGIGVDDELQTVKALLSARIHHLEAN